MQLGEVGSQAALADQHHGPARAGDLAPPVRRPPVRGQVRTQGTHPVDVARQFGARVLERRRTSLQVQVRGRRCLHDRHRPLGQAQGGPDLVVPPLRGSEDEPPAGGAYDPVADPAQRPGPRQQGRSERRRVGVLDGQRPVAEGGPWRATELVDHPDPVHQPVAEHRVDVVLREDGAQVGDPPDRLGHEDVGEGPPDRTDPMKARSFREPLLQIGRAEILGGLVRQRDGPRRTEPVVEGCPGVPEHRVAALDQSLRERKGVHRVRGNGDAGEQEGGHVAPRRAVVRLSHSQLVLG